MMFLLWYALHLGLFRSLFQFILVKFCRLDLAGLENVVTSFNIS
jgi:hypothetical protein